MSSYYLGLANSCHDPAIAIIDPEGKILFAEALERPLQNKIAWDTAPDHFHRIKDLIETYCNPQAKFIVATTWSKNSLQKFRSKILDPEVFLDPKKDQVSPYLIYQYDIDWVFQLHELAVSRAGINLAVQMRSQFNNEKVSFRQFPHHLTHAANACYSSPFKEAACIIVDGEGEFGAISCYQYKDGKFKRVQRSLGAGSLGKLYSIVTKLCGFDWRKGEQWKVMGLSAYGKIDPEAYELIRGLIEIDSCRLKFASVEKLQISLEYLSAKARHPAAPPWEAADIAYTAQKVFAEVMTELLNNFYSMGISDNLVLGGGCGLNSAFNGTITQLTSFKNVHIPSAPGDDGNALGAAWLAYYEDNPNSVHQPQLKSPYLGSLINRKGLKNLVRFSNIRNIKHLPGKIHLEAARLLAEGKLLGWVQGRAEFGPRALGNRSILADPRSPKMKQIINQRVKFREEFRPFAPAILHEFGEQYFENYQESPYMSFALKWRSQVQDKLPAVVHVNETGRLQTVKREWNQKFYDLIFAFYEITGVPVVLNTSFNIMGKPIIHSVEDAISVFYTTGLDALVIEDYLIEKQQQENKYEKSRNLEIIANSL